MRKAKYVVYLLTLLLVFSSCAGKTESLTERAERLLNQYKSQQREILSIHPSLQLKEEELDTLELLSPLFFGGDSKKAGDNIRIPVVKEDRIISVLAYPYGGTDEAYAPLLNQLREEGNSYLIVMKQDNLGIYGYSADSGCVYQQTGQKVTMMDYIPKEIRTLLSNEPDYCTFEKSDTLTSIFRSK